MLRESFKIWILIILHTVGLIGLNSPYKELFFNLSAINLLITAWLLLDNLGKKEIWFYAIVFLLSFAIEAIGVATRFPFGHYIYGHNLGPKIFDVPLVIGLNWVILLRAALSTCSNNYFFAAILMTTIDFFIEAKAPKLGYWFWHTKQIPMANYIAWFVIALIFGLAHHFFKISNRKNKNIDIAFLTILIMFFLLV
jgi:putative membrane protein